MCASLCATWLIGVSAPLAALELRTPTPMTGVGLFYRADAPASGLLWREGDSGDRLQLVGRLVSTEGLPVASARVEIWHADGEGQVYASRYRASLTSARDGSFRLDTVLPGHVDVARGDPVFAPRHIHVAVTHPDYFELVSLILFKGDAPLPSSAHPELGIVLERALGNDGPVLLGRVELVLRPAR